MEQQKQNYRKRSDKSVKLKESPLVVTDLNISARTEPNIKRDVSGKQEVTSKLEISVKQERVSKAKKEEIKQEETKKEEVFVGEKKVMRPLGVKEITEKKEERNFDKLEEMTKTYVKKLFREEVVVLKESIHREISNLQFEMMKLMEVNKRETIEEIKKLLGLSREVEDEMKRLKEENERLKTNLY